MDATEWLGNPVRPTSESMLAGSKPKASNRIFWSLSNRGDLPCDAIRASKSLTYHLF